MVEGREHIVVSQPLGERYPTYMLALPGAKPGQWDRIVGAHRMTRTYAPGERVMLAKHEYVVVSRFLDSDDYKVKRPGAHQDSWIIATGSRMTRVAEGQRTS